MPICPRPEREFTFRAGLTDAPDHLALDEALTDGGTDCGADGLPVAVKHTARAQVVIAHFILSVTAREVALLLVDDEEDVIEHAGVVSDVRDCSSIFHGVFSFVVEYSKRI